MNALFRGIVSVVVVLVLVGGGGLFILVLFSVFSCVGMGFGTLDGSIICILIHLLNFLVSLSWVILWGRVLYK